MTDDRVEEKGGPVAWLCRFDGSVHRKGVHHLGDTPLVPQPVAGALAVVLAEHGSHWSTPDGHHECYCSHVLSEHDETWEEHVTQAFAAQMMEGAR